MDAGGIRKELMKDGRGNENRQMEG